MSMNLHVSAEIDAILANGKPYKICNSFGLWQTPTEDTYKMVESNNVKDSYITWVRSHYDENDEKRDREEYDEYLKECKTLGYESPPSYESHINRHIRELSEWLLAHDGWEINWYVM